MRVVLVNWAPIAEGAENGGGANGYCQGLAVGLADRGHEVSCIASGFTYVSGHGVAARRHPDYRGVRVFEIVNSPVVAPGPCQHKDPLAEVSSPELEREFTRLIGLLRPDIVHFQNAEGFSAGCLGTAASAGARVIFSLHNYHTVCPQVYLMQRGRRPCHSYDNGHACTGCIDLPPPEQERRKRAELFARDRGFNTAPPPPIPGLTERLGAVLSPPRPPAPGPVPLPGQAVNVLLDLLLDAAKPQVVQRVAAATPDPAELAPLGNDARPDPPTDKPPNEYAGRRAAFVAALSACDAVVGVSRFVRDKFEALGVRPDALRVMHIGSRMREIADTMPEVRVTPPPFSPPRPVRAAFIGYHNYYKGLHMLLDSLELMGEELRGLDLFVSAKGVEEIMPRLELLRPRLARLTVERGYQYHEVPRLLAGRDVGLVPSVWWDNGPQTVMEFFACGVPVIAAELGGIPDLVRHHHNGLLHRGNDREHLARTLGAVLHEPSALSRLRANVEPLIGMTEHVGQMESLYDEVRRGRPSRSVDNKEGIKA